jgi:formylglycine-generating enzyme required for sulfatase activity
VWNLGNHPVVGVTWYEVDAYCQWLTARLRRTVRLPTESEWEFAARGEDARLWPWGNEFDAARCNMSDTGVGRTTPVGMFSSGGDSPFGVTDLAGNVWEWCATKWRADYGTPEDNDREGQQPRVLRGGAYDDSREALRCAYRFWGNPGGSSAVVGFRVVTAGRDSTRMR